MLRVIAPTSTEPAIMNMAFILSSFLLLVSPFEARSGWLSRLVDLWYLVAVPGCVGLVLRGFSLLGHHPLSGLEDAFTCIEAFVFVDEHNHERRDGLTVPGKPPYRVWQGFSHVVI